ncbi:universal stress protein [Polynucleobacter sp. MWH-Berg-3C6]|uniref:universal stress protein n=1 Tax=Polynucleobacter sp. MWH-Berg-3C6 TaxID=1855882 RepID=UPI001C0ADEBF|nr:universal stress protein [Polynucleobacter sp. MWH-Berg-3C6]MBU3551343.1 universal stress protein [Polynucleobacter sp. MWH-Berg-3C6]
MFKKLLVPISNDVITKKELKKVIKLAKLDNARITLVYVSDPLAPYIYTESVNNLMISEAAHKKACEAFAKKLFLKAKVALGSDLAVDSYHIVHPNIADGILEAAKKAKADAIVMSSHKRTGLAGLLLHSEAQEVILHSTIPVVILN